MKNPKRVRLCGTEQVAPTFKGESWDVASPDGLLVDGWQLPLNWTIPSRREAEAPKSQEVNKYRMSWKTDTFRILQGPSPSDRCS